MIALLFSDSIIISLCDFMLLLIMSSPPPTKKKKEKKRKERNISICKSQMLWPSEFLNWVRVT
jgi:hypothetical protein